MHKKNRQNHRINKKQGTSKQTQRQQVQNSRFKGCRIRIHCVYDYAGLCCLYWITDSSISSTDFRVFSPGRSTPSWEATTWCRWGPRGRRGSVWCVETLPLVITTAWRPARPARRSSRGPYKVRTAEMIKASISVWTCQLLISHFSCLVSRVQMIYWSIGVWSDLH